MFGLNEMSVARLHELADLQHPHLKGKNHTRLVVDKAYNKERLTIDEAFDCGKYYQRMLDQLPLFEKDVDLYTEYIHAILDFKHECYINERINK